MNVVTLDTMHEPEKRIQKIATETALGIHLIPLAFPPA